MVQPIIMCITLTVSTVFSDFPLFMLKLNTRLLSWIFSSSSGILTTKFYFKLIRKIFWPNFILRLLIFRYFTCTEHFIPTLQFFFQKFSSGGFSRWRTHRFQSHNASLSKFHPKKVAFEHCCQQREHNVSVWQRFQNEGEIF